MLVVMCMKCIKLTLTSMCSRLIPSGYLCERVGQNNRVLDNGRVAGSLGIDPAELGQRGGPV